MKENYHGYNRWVVREHVNFVRTDELAESDKIISPKDFNARLTVTLPENGIYYLMANTFEGGESGNYSLRAVISQK